MEDAQVLKEMAREMNAAFYTSLMKLQDSDLMNFPDKCLLPVLKIVSHYK